MGDCQVSKNSKGYKNYVKQPATNCERVPSQEHNVPHPPTTFEELLQLLNCQIPKPSSARNVYWKSPISLYANYFVPFLGNCMSQIQVYEETQCYFC